MQKLKLLAWICLLTSMPPIVFCQARTVTGTVRNDNGQPVSLATIQLKGTNTATTANQEGAFRISVNGNNVVLVVSSVSYQTREVAVGSDSVFNVELTEAGNLEVVVTALGISGKKRPWVMLLK